MSGTGPGTADAITWPAGADARTLAPARGVAWARAVEVALPIALVMVAGLIRWIDLWSLPIFTDEGDEIGLALRIVREGARPLTNDDPYLGPVFNYLLAGLFRLAGPSPWLPRALMLALGALTVGAVYLLARELTLEAGGDDRRAMLGGALAAGLLAVNPSHVVVISHVAWGACLMPFLTTTACWLLVRAVRLGVRDRMAQTAGLTLVLAGLVFGLAFQTHPMMAAFFPAIIVFVVWRARGWLLTPWPYLGGVAFIVAQLPTLLFVAREGPGRWLAAIHEKQTMYDGPDAADASTMLGRLVGLLHTLAVSLGGLINDRDTALPAIWHPASLLAVALAIVALAWLWRRGLPLLPLIVLANVALLPMVNGKFAPIINNSRYLVPTVIVLAAAIGAWAASYGPSITRSPGLDLARTRMLVPCVLVLILGVSSGVALVSFSVAAHREERTNNHLLASMAALEAAYRPGDVVVVDRAMLRDWTLTEGRLQRVVASWLDLLGLPNRVVDVEENGRLRADLANGGGLAVLAQKTVTVVARTYQIEEIAKDAAPGAPPGSGYAIVRVTGRR